MASLSDLSLWCLCMAAHEVLFSIISDYFPALWLFLGFSFFFFRSALCLRNTHSSKQCVDTLSMPVSPRITPRVDAQHSIANTKHSAQQHLIQDLTHNQPWARQGRRFGWLRVGVGGWSSLTLCPGQHESLRAQTCRLRSSVACCFFSSLFCVGLPELILNERKVNSFRTRNGFKVADTSWKHFSHLCCSLHWGFRLLQCSLAPPPARIDARELKKTTKKTPLTTSVSSSPSVTR